MCDRRPGDVASSYATCERAEKELQWKSKLNLYDMCKGNRASQKEICSLLRNELSHVVS